MTNNSKVIYTFFLLICLSPFVQGQHLSIDVLASSGNEVLGEESSLIWTIGENFVETLEITEGVQTLGFHQTYDFMGRQNEAEKNTLWIYPNPVLNTLNIQSKEYVGDANLQVFAITGELVFERKIQMENRYTLNLSFLNEGNYHLRITNHKIQNFQFIKLSD
ncbi:MAG: T9SS type A sorting domain-containing protein [Bacteroidota bacterium]